MDGFGDFDFNVSGGQGDFQGNQNIVIEDSNTNPESNDNNIYQENNINNHNLPTENEIKEKPKSNFGLINDPNSKDENLNNNNIIISQENQETTKSTLDEPITTTLKRDLLVIGNKIKFVIIPKITERKIEELYNWDLWGPLIFCFLYSIALSTGNTNSETSIFVLIFTIFWVGGFVITFNEKFLGSNIGICQTLSLLGYGMFPIIVAGIIIGFCGINNIYVKLILVVVGLIWSILASHGFFSSLVEPDKKMLAFLNVICFGKVRLYIHKFLMYVAF